MESSLAAADLTIGARCAGCGVAAWGMCAVCIDQIRPQPLTVDVQGIAVPVIAGGRYETTLRACLVAWKEQGFEQLTSAWPHHLAASIVALGEDHVTLVRVPARPGRVRQPGFDAVVAATCQHLADVGIVAVSAAVLHWTRVTQAQKRLRREQRQANMYRALTADSRKVAAPIVVVDDIVTTGATLAAAVHALRRRGHHVCGCATIAATDRVGLKSALAS